MSPADWAVPVLGYALQGAVAYQARAVAKRRPFHTPFAALALWLAVEDPLHPLLDLARPHTGHPYAGAPLVLWTLDRTLFLSYPLGLAVVAWMVFTDARPWHGLGLSALVMVALAVTYPASSAPWVGAVVHGAALLVAVVAIVRWCRRRCWPSGTQGLVLTYVAADVALFGGPYATAHPREAWGAALPLYLALQVSTLAVQAIWWRKTSPGVA